MPITRRTALAGAAALLGQPSDHQWTAERSIDLARATIPSSVGIVQTWGFNTPGDGGGALYRRIAGAASLSSVQRAAALQSADGSLWALAEPIPRVEMLGAVGDGKADDTPAFEKALAIAKVVWCTPERRYRLTKPIDLRSGQQLLGYGASNDLSNLSVTELIFDHGHTGIQLGVQGAVISGFKLSRPAATQAPTISLENSSFSKLSDLRVGVNGGVGLLYRGDGANACYFNERHNVSIYGEGKCAVQYLGPNCTVNRSFGGKIAMTKGDGLLYAGQALENLEVGLDIEGCVAGAGVVNDSGSNSLIACHLEDNQVGVLHNTGGLRMVCCGIAPHAGQKAEDGDGRAGAINLGSPVLMKNGRRSGFLCDLLRIGADPGRDTTVHFDIEAANRSATARFSLFQDTAGAGREIVAYMPGADAVAAAVPMWSVSKKPGAKNIAMKLGDFELISSPAQTPDGANPAGPGSVLHLYRTEQDGKKSDAELWIAGQNDRDWKMLTLASGGTTENRPHNLSVRHIGYPWFDTTMGRMVWWDGSHWKDALGKVS